MITQESQEKEAMKSAKEKSALETKKMNRKNKTNAIRQYIKKAVIAFAIKAGAVLLGSLLVFGIIGVALDLFGGGDSSTASAYNGSDFINISSFEGSTVQEKVWLALRTIGYSEYAVAGAMGNIHYESSRI